MNKFDFTPVKELLNPKRKIFLTSHFNPDGDALGAMLGLYRFLLKMGHEVNMMVPNKFPGFLNWMPSQEHILRFDENKHNCQDLFLEADVLFALDYNEPSRINNAGKFFTESSAVKVLIDHHLQPMEEAFDHCFSTVDVSSTSELVYEFMQAINPNLVDKPIAECIYTGIMTDTGCFSYNCSYERTFAISGELVGKGINTDEINRLVYGTNSESKIRLTGYAISQKMKVMPKYKTAYIALTREELRKYKYTTGDTEGLVNYALSVKGIRFAALITERNKKIRISFRSVGDFSVNEFARKYFEGGGHRNAAGGDSFIGMDKTLEKFERLVRINADKI